MKQNKLELACGKHDHIEVNWCKKKGDVSNGRQLTNSFDHEDYAKSS